MPRDLSVFAFHLETFLESDYGGMPFGALYCMCILSFFCTLKILAYPRHSPRDRVLWTGGVICFLCVYSMQRFHV